MKQVEVFPALKLTSHFLPQSGKIHRQGCNKSAARPHLALRVVSSVWIAILRITIISERSLMCNSKAIKSKMKP